MRQSDKAYLDSLEVKLKAMHQPHLGRPSHELEYDEDDFRRVFGAGDEQQETPRRTDQVQFDHGCRDGDFA